MNTTTTSESSTISQKWKTLEPRFYPGPGSRARIGLLVLATDMSIEWDMLRYLHLKGVDCLTSRMPMAPQANKNTLAALKGEILTAAENLVSWAKFDAIAFCCTSGAIAVGPEKIHEMVQSVKPGVAVCNPVDSALDALNALNCKKVALITPYIDEVNETLETYFTHRGLELTNRAAFKQAGDPQINLIDPQCLLEEAKKLELEESDALFISCTGLCTSGIVQQIEDRIGKPVITSNQALSWAVLRAAGVTDSIKGFGQIFEAN